ncbi:permease [Candidatus Aerophobetes bacterium]|nr:permease [Candidatus Aerophobetes bacterium]
MLVSILLSGVRALIEYLSAHVLTCLVPAFFIAGAISSMVKKEIILKYFGPSANKVLSYAIASVAGTVLAVCSCTILPLFSGIYSLGAGIGPATTFLYSGPAINLLAIIYSARLLGIELGIARAIGAVGFSIVIGLIMSSIFEKKRTKDAEKVKFSPVADPKTPSKNPAAVLLFFADLVGILIFGAWGQWLIVTGLLVLLVIVLKIWFTKNEILSWLAATYQFVLLILPWLLVGVFAAGIIREFLPPEVIRTWVGGNALRSNFIASVAGSLMYFATLTEVPILRAFLDLGMGRGPALALLLAGPALSLPNMLVIRSIMGTKRALVYITLVVAMSTFIGMLFGIFVF